MEWTGRMAAGRGRGGVVGLSLVHTPPPSLRSDGDQRGSGRSPPDRPRGRERNWDRAAGGVRRPWSSGQVSCQHGPEGGRERGDGGEREGWERVRSAGQKREGSPNPSRPQCSMLGSRGARERVTVSAACACQHTRSCVSEGEGVWL